MSNLKPWVTKFFTKLILSKTAKNTYILSFADISMAILAAITTAIIARNLSPGEFGTFLALWTFLTLISALLDLGIGAGTSTPHSQIEAVKKKIVELYLGKVVFREGKERLAC